jgi:hypothetical protein
VFISRKTQRLYVRRGFQPILDTPVTILEPERPIGTHVFTAMERIKSDNAMRWSVVSLNRDARTREGPEGEPTAKEPSDAKSALDRIVISQDALARMAETVSPRSSLIISDEEVSSETGKGTDFVILLSGEPQGGIAIRRSRPATEVWYRYERPRYRPPFWR